MVEIILTVSYILVGFYVFIQSVKHYRSKAWVGFDDLLGILLCFGVLWPIALLVSAAYKIQDSNALYSFLKMVNGKGK